jgi:MFS-type transporter involved in bile tolerance (Atg22 family)
MLAGYFCFGMGYIGYMTFVISLLRELHWAAWQTGVFYAVMGLCGMFSVQLWSGALDRFKAGQCLAIVNSLLAMACVIPACIALSIGVSDWHGLDVAAIFASGMVFGGCFATAVASTTAFIKHNLPPTQWVSVITVFTSVFALGQVFGPSLTGWVSDHTGGLSGGLLFSAAILGSGTLLAWRQNPLMPKD